MVTTTETLNSAYTNEELDAIEGSLLEEEALDLSDDDTAFDGVGDLLTNRHGQKVRAFQIQTITQPPAFVEVYDNNGLPSKVRRVDLRRYLAKTGRDGARAFHLRRPKGTGPLPLPETCDYPPCTKRLPTLRAKTIHMRTYHPEEWGGDHEQEAQTDAQMNRAILDRLAAQGVNLEALTRRLLAMEPDLVDEAQAARLFSQGPDPVAETPAATADGAPKSVRPRDAHGHFIKEGDGEWRAG